MSDSEKYGLASIEQYISYYPGSDSNYRVRNSRGELFIRDKKIIVTGLVRNGGEYLSSNIKHLSKIFEIAKDYRIIIYENDSNDNTKDLLLDLSNKNSKIEFTSETNDRQMYGQVKDRARTVALAEYRNKNLEIIKAKYSDFDYVVVVDLDFEELPVKSVYNSFGQLVDHVDNPVGMSGFAYTLKQFNEKIALLWNYDSWAYRPNWWHDLDYVTRLDSQITSMTWFGYMLLPIGSPTFAVNSNFGGMAIYRVKDYVEGQYEGSDCEHVTFHLSLRQKVKHLMIANPSQVILGR